MRALAGQPRWWPRPLGLGAVGTIDGPGYGGSAVHVDFGDGLTGHLSIADICREKEYDELRRRAGTGAAAAAAEEEDGRLDAAQWREKEDDGSGCGQSPTSMAATLEPPRRPDPSRGNAHINPRRDVDVGRTLREIIT